jgi:hypothetical protein
MYSYRERSIPLYLATAIECWRKSYDPQSAPSPVLHSLSGFDCKIEKEFKNDGQHRESLKAMWSKKIGMENVQALTSSFVEAKAGITHPDEFVRIVAAGILRIYWPAETKQLRTHLCLMLQSDSSPRVRAAVAGLLASLYVHSDDKELEAIFLSCFSNLTGADDFRKGVYTAMLSLRGIPPTVWPLSVAFGTSEWESDTDKGFIASFENE